MPKMQIEFDGFDLILKKLNSLNANTKAIAEDALKETHKIVTEKAERAMQKSNLPAKGNFSRAPHTLDALRRQAEIEWSGDVGTVHVGFDIRHGGLASIFLMYGTSRNGTPRMEPAKGLEGAFYSSATRKQIKDAQEKIYYDALHRVLNR